MKKLSLNDCIYFALRDGRYRTFWEIQTLIKEKTGKFYGEPTISAGIRNMRKDHCRSKYGLKTYGEVITKKRLDNGKGYKYRLIKE
jgi:hypothetical protein